VLVPEAAVVRDRDETRPPLVSEQIRCLPKRGDGTRDATHLRAAAGIWHRHVLAEVLVEHMAKARRKRFDGCPDRRKFRMGEEFPARPWARI
jgi:hypothetical protein